MKILIRSSIPIPLAMTVASAEPATPIFGKIHIPKINKGSSIILSTVEKIRTFIGVNASPAPLNVEVREKVIKIVNEPTEIILKY